MSVFLVVTPLICFSFLSPGGVLRNWKRVGVIFFDRGRQNWRPRFPMFFLQGVSNDGEESLGIARNHCESLGIAWNRQESLGVAGNREESIGVARNRVERFLGLALEMLKTRFLKFFWNDF